MSNSSAAERLKALAQSDAPRSKTARVRQVFNDIEACQREGYSLTQIMNSLNEEGFNLELGAFRVILSRIRKDRAESEAGKSPAAPVNASSENLPTVTKPLARPHHEVTRVEAEPVESGNALHTALDMDNRESKFNQYEKAASKKKFRS